MGFSTSPLAFDDVREAFDKALAAVKGIKIRCKSRGAAINLRQRFNTYRKMDRQTNAKIYTEDEPMWKRSVYDTLQLRVPPQGHPDERVLFIEKRTVDDLAIELITEEIGND